MKMHRTIFLLIICLCLMDIGLLPAAAAADSAQLEQHDGDPSNSDTQLFTKPLILIDAGHGGIDGGTSYQDILEKHINLAIGQKLYLLLKSKGIPTVLNRTGDYALSEDNRWSVTRSRHLRDLAQRYQLSEELPVSIYVSIHVNWGKNKNTRGAVVLHQEEGRSRLLAATIQQHLNALYGKQASHATEIGNTYYLLRKVKQPAVIVETGFISNPNDRELLTSSRGQAAIAQQICDALEHYLLLFH